jgi:hypothetical protein
VSVTALAAEFAQAAVGVAIPVALTAAQLAGATAANYALSLAGAPAAAAAIVARTITLGGAFTAQDKAYDGTAAAAIASHSLTLVGVIAPDAVALTGLAAAFEDAEVGEGKPVHLTAGSLAGDQAANYALSLAGAPTATASITAPVTPQHTLTLTVAGSGAVAVNGAAYTAPITADQGTVLELEALPDEGWRFAGWSGDLTGPENPASHTLTADAAITATFEPIPEHTLTVAVVGSGAVTVNGAPYAEPVVAQEGTELVLDAAPAGGWRFEGWSGDLTGGTCPASVLLNADCAVTATFAPITGAGLDPLAGLEAFPNPFGDALHLRHASGVHRVTIASIIGQRVLEVNLGGADSASIPTGELPRGIYLITFHGTNGERLVRKLVKE